MSEASSPKTPSPEKLQKLFEREEEKMDNMEPTKKATREELLQEIREFVQKEERWPRFVLSRHGDPDLMPHSGKEYLEGFGADNYSVLRSNLMKELNLCLVNGKVKPKKDLKGSIAHAEAKELTGEELAEESKVTPEPEIAVELEPEPEPTPESEPAELLVIEQPKAEEPEAEPPKQESLSLSRSINADGKEVIEIRCNSMDFEMKTFEDGSCQIRIVH